jgi:hypothetical protein
MYQQRLVYREQQSTYTKSISAIRQSITQDYLPWMQKNTQSMRRLTRFRHWHMAVVGLDVPNHY